MVQSHSKVSPSLRVAAIVVNWNGRDLLEHALRSLEKQHYENLEVIVVDNGSEDGSQDMIRETFPKVRLMQNQKNLGFGGANNRGIYHALSDGADYCILLNYDAVAAEDCVEMLINCALETSAGIVGSKIFYHEPRDLIWSAGGNIGMWTGAFSHRGIRSHDKQEFSMRRDVDYVSGCTMLIKRELIAQIGAFDDAYFPSYCEDVDLCQRARLAGWRVLYEPDATAWHRVSAHSGGGITSLKVRLRVRNQYIFFRRYARWYQWTTIVPVTAGRMVTQVFRWILSGRWNLISSLLGGLITTISPRKSR